MVSIKAIFISFVVTTVVVVNAGVTDFKKLIFTDPDADEFAAIMNANNYNAKNIPDVIKRLGYFKKAKKMVQELQAKSKGSAVFGMNKFSLMSDEERQKVSHLAKTLCKFKIKNFSSSVLCLPLTVKSEKSGMPLMAFLVKLLLLHPLISVTTAKFRQ